MRQLLIDNLDVVFFIYGLAFIVMGIAILLQPKQNSGHRIAGILWLLAVFGITHGANELLDMWAIIKGRHHALDVVRWFFLALSYCFLFEFGRRFFRLERAKAPAWQKKLSKPFVWWLLPAMGLFIFITGLMSHDLWETGSILTRYLMGLPGGLLIGIGFLKEYEYEKECLEPLKVKKFYVCSGLAFLIYGILGGMIVPKGDFFPASALNTDSFSSTVKIPVQAFRALCALAAAWSVSGILKIFNWELKDKLQKHAAGLKAINEELEKEIAEHERTEKALKGSHEKLRASLGEKDILLKEIHHRVKNNMQVVSSLLNLQADQIEDRRYVEMFNESRNRIRAMALVHEKLYQSSDLANINFNDYIASLAKSLLMFYGKNYGGVSMKIDALDINLAIDAAIPCGLIINELISNSLKHAFPEGRKGAVLISFKKTDNEYELTVSDDGAGIPEGFDVSKTKSLGLQLVSNLVEHQLQGRLELHREKGTEFRIRFKELMYKKRI
ncbi:MAG: sensor histidine kinase [Nitrospirae bacterium]|nr:sensor histidine kinase [Nitrospirota bacterium]